MGVLESAFDLRAPGFLPGVCFSNENEQATHVCENEQGWDTAGTQPKQDPATYGTSLGHLWRLGRRSVLRTTTTRQQQQHDRDDTRTLCLAVVSPGRCYNCALNNGARCPGSVPAWAQPLPRSALHRAPRASVHAVHGRCGAPPPGGSTRRRRVRSRRALGGEQLTRRPAPPPW